jgi:uncharacterized membrane-anchored protein YhcB (DUF1043 family)
MTERKKIEFNNDDYREEVVAKVASSSIEAFRMMSHIYNTGSIKSFEDFNKVVDDPNNSAIRELLDKAKEEVNKHIITKGEFLREIAKQDPKLTCLD